MIPTHPAAHYLMGGVKTDLFGRTSLRNPYAAGEVACTGVHGANRLASNSLLEGLVYGARAGQTAVADTHGSIPASVESKTMAFPENSGERRLALRKRRKLSSA